jgi:Fe-S-cluster containining protein
MRAKQQRRVAKILSKRRHRALRLLQEAEAAADQDALSPEAAVMHTAAVRTLVALSAGCTAQQATQAGERVMTWLGTLLDQTPPAQPLACRPGCAFCCYLPVAVTPAEALYLAAWLRQQLATEGLATVRTHLATEAVVRRQLSSDASAVVQRPCVFLRDAQCSVYAARPLACRWYTSVDRSRCERAFQAKTPDADVPADPTTFLLGMLVGQGLRQGCQAAEVDAADYELHSAVLCALETPHVAEKWARGEPVFAACTPSVRPPPLPALAWLPVDGDSTTSEKTDG